MKLRDVIIWTFDIIALDSGDCVERDMIPGAGLPPKEASWPRTEEIPRFEDVDPLRFQAAKQYLDLWKNNAFLQDQIYDKGPDSQVRFY
jgi:hypothetical protein